jgi:hypothetical protein
MSVMFQCLARVTVGAFSLNVIMKCYAIQTGLGLESPDSGQEFLDLYNAVGRAWQHPTVQYLLAQVYVS